MNIKNCTRCGKIYNYDHFKICPVCRRKDEDDFEKVKAYLREYPGADIQTVSDETGVDTRKIIEFLKEGRLEVGEGSQLLIQCESCGASIKTGRFCEKCATNISRELRQSVAPMRPNSTGKKEEKFRVVDRYEKRK